MRRIEHSADVVITVRLTLELYGWCYRSPVSRLSPVRHAANERSSERSADPVRFVGDGMGRPRRSSSLLRATWVGSTTHVHQRDWCRSPHSSKRVRLRVR